MNSNEIKTNIYHIIKDYKYEIISISIIFIYLCPYLVLGESIPVLIHDNLDAQFIWYDVLIKSGNVFSPSSTIVENIMNGIRRGSLGSEFSILMFLFYIFKPFNVYLINAFLIHYIAFIGMYLLLKTHLIKGSKNAIIYTGAALCFAILPFWPVGGLSIAGQPLVLFAMLNIRSKRSSYLDWLIIIFVPFYSYFVFSFLFFLFGATMLFIYDLINQKRINFPFFYSISLMSIVYAIVEYRLIIDTFISKSFVSHRTEFGLWSYGISETLNKIIGNFIYGQYHAHSIPGHVILPIIIVGIILLLFRKKFNEKIFFLFLTGFVSSSILFKNAKVYGLTLILLLVLLITIKLFILAQKTLRLKNNPKGINENLFLYLLIGLLGISIFYGIYNWNIFDPIKNNILYLKIFQFDRFYILQPIVFYILFSLSLYFIFTKVSWKILRPNIVIGGILILQILILFSVSSHYSPLIRNIDSPSYSSFFAEDLFNNIKKDIGKSPEDYRVINIGFHPSVSLYNGFYTLDGYVSNYDIEYKHQFRKLMERELEKNQEQKRYFDEWGSRCYFFVAELPEIMYTKDSNAKVTNLEMNTSLFKQMGGEFILSAVEITNYSENDLIFINTYEDNVSIWKIYLYEAK